jgi:hypothetical protein
MAPPPASTQPPAPPAAPDATEIAALAQQSRHGYSGGDGPMASNAEPGKDRIVLDADFGGAPPPKSLAALDIAARDVATQLAGCAGRYADKVVIVTGGA